MTRFLLRFATESDHAAMEARADEAGLSLNNFILKELGCTLHENGGKRVSAKKSVKPQGVRYCERCADFGEERKAVVKVGGLMLCKKCAEEASI